MAAKNLYEAFANHISEYVQSHLDQDIIIDDLAQNIGVSKFHLNRLFQATTGFQLGEFVQRRRLQKAYSLLAMGNKSVMEVSLTVGYESHSAFSRAFLKAFDCTPSEVKLGSQCEWKTPNTLKNSCGRDATLQPEMLKLSTQKFSGLYGAGFKDNSFMDVGHSLFAQLGEYLHKAGLGKFYVSPIGISLESPWQREQDQSRFFVGVSSEQLPSLPGLADYLWQEGTWARFYHRGSYRLMWQSISRIYAGWVIPEGIRLKDDAIVQVYLNNPNDTAEAELVTALYFPILI
jgi:AraC family transcriptional regulator